MSFAAAFILVSATMIAAWRGSRRLALSLFATSLAALVLIYAHHATDTLPLAF